MQSQTRCFLLNTNRNELQLRTETPLKTIQHFLSSESLHQSYKVVQFYGHLNYSLSNLKLDKFFFFFAFPTEQQLKS